MQEITPNQMRGQVTALYLLLANIFGIGLGPTVVAFFTDHVFGQERALGLSLSITVGLFGPIAIALFWQCRRAYRGTLDGLEF